MISKKELFKYNVLWWFVIIICLLLLTCSCGSSKNQSKSSWENTLEQKNDSVGNQKESSFQKEETYTNKKTDIEIAKDTETTTVNEKFDKDGILTERTTTTQKENVSTKEQTNENKQSSNHEDTSKENNAIVNSNTNKSDVGELEELNQKDETTVPKQIGWMCVGIAILIAAIIIGWLVYRRRRK